MYSSLIVFGIVHVVQSIHYFHQYFKKPVPRKIKRMVKLIMNFLRIKNKANQWQALYEHKIQIFITVLLDLF